MPRVPAAACEAGPDIDTPTLSSLSLLADSLPAKHGRSCAGRESLGLAALRTADIRMVVPRDSCAQRACCAAGRSTGSPRSTTPAPCHSEPSHRLVASSTGAAYCRHPAARSPSMGVEGACRLAGCQLGGGSSGLGSATTSPCSRSTLPSQVMLFVCGGRTCYAASSVGRTAVSTREPHNAEKRWRQLRSASRRRTTAVRAIGLQTLR